MSPIAYEYCETKFLCGYERNSVFASCLFIYAFFSECLYEDEINSVLYGVNTYEVDVGRYREMLQIELVEEIVCVS